MGKNSPVTLGQLAAKAGVSRSTAGLILKGRAKSLRISDATAKRVFDAANSLGYLHNSSARRLKSKRTNQVAYVMNTNELARGTISGFIFVMIQHLQQRGYQTVIIDLAMNPFKENPLFLERRFDGMVIDGNITQWENLRNWGERHHVPYVFLHNDDAVENNVGIDEAKTAAYLIGSLHEMGFRKLAYYFPRNLMKSSRYPSDHILLRERLLRMEIQKRNLPLCPDTVTQRRYDENTARYLMTLPDPPECVIGFGMFYGLEFMKQI